jgi:hypothetical protein
MRFIYLVEKRQLNNTTNCFELYDTEAFSSLKKAQAAVENSIECNKGFDINRDTTSYLEKNLGRIDYTSLGWGRDDARVEMRLRLIINKKELR